MPTTTTAPRPARADGEQADWRTQLRPYTRPHVGLALLDVSTSVLAYLVLSAVGLALVDGAWWIAALLWVPTAGFLLRTFIVFHDCAHGSFLPSRRANLWLGRLAALLVFTPFGAWRHSHAVHHASAGDLDRRGEGDVPTKTVEEYLADGPRDRLLYRLFRHPAVMFTVGPIWAMVIAPRLWSATQRPRIRHSVQLTDLALVAAVGTLVALLGWDTYLLAQGPVVFLAAAAGVWMFFVQHQFEDAYWERGGDWDYADAALRGSSHLRLPRVLRFFSGNIGLHHVHHLSAKVPNYRLQAAHDALPILHAVPELTIADGLRATRLGLWDEARGRLVPFSAVRGRATEAT